MNLRHSISKTCPLTFVFYIHHKTPFEEMHVNVVSLERFICTNASSAFCALLWKRVLSRQSLLSFRCARRPFQPTSGIAIHSEETNKIVNTSPNHVLSECLGTNNITQLYTLLYDICTVVDKHFITDNATYCKITYISIDRSSKIIRTIIIIWQHFYAPYIWQLKSSRGALQ